MPMYEFECPKGHRSEDLCAIGTKHIPCPSCDFESRNRAPGARPSVAERILSPTRTNFEFADQRRKRSIE